MKNGILFILMTGLFCASCLEEESNNQISPSVPQVNSRCRLTQTEQTKVFIKKQVLEFAKIEAGSVNIALKEREAMVFHRKAQQMLPSRLLYPFILKSVSEKERPKLVTTFWIQVAPINPAFYSQIVPNALPDRVSLQDAKIFIGKLNKRCQGVAKFDLPTEQQFVYLAKSIYNPVKTRKLAPCHTLSQLTTENGVKQLLGYKWQLTNTKCEPLNANPIMACDDKMYIKKGGTTESKNATECLPEYRAESSPQIREPKTTFRLVFFK